MGNRQSAMGNWQCLLFRVDRKSCLLPTVKTTQQRGCVCDPFVLEYVHRTGGRVFVGSRTIGDYCLVARELAATIGDLGKRNQFRAVDVGLVKG